MVANRAKIQGWDAYHAGRSTDSNPYPYGSANHRDWEDGWKEARMTWHRQAHVDE